jgi:ATP-dependent helicase Lhr and Lhr-like helicase
VEARRAADNVQGLMPDPLAHFTPAVREWFGRAFAAPTAAQAQAWPAIATGEHVLISAPTGSGKTLAAFLYGLDRFLAEPSHERTRLVYVSPLKALSYDVEKNLRAPLRGIGAELNVAIRTGDTPQRERRDMVKHPPDVLITTPESLYLMLTSRAREIFAETETVIVDEIHAVAQTKRGAHLAITLERLVEQAGRDVQRVGLSATQNPLEEVGRFMVGPSRRCTVVDTGVRKPLDLKIHVPVESMVEPENMDLELDPFAGGEATRKSIWPAIYPELLELVRQHRSTLIFVNNRRAAERLALRLNELAEESIARAHHGSLAREERLVVEEQLKAGELPCLVATSSLELGIDMGAVDLVLQVESPKSVTAGLQRIGRAGHNVGDTSKGRIFPKFRADLLECAVVAQRMREGKIETTVVPRNPLDVLAQQIVAMAASSEDEPLSVDALAALLARTYTYAELSRAQLENVLDMLDGRYPSEEFGELRPRIVWDRVNQTLRARKGARALAITNAGTIPDRGLYSVNLPDGRRVGELDEEMVYEARPGQVFLLGASSWRIEEITRDRVIVSPAPGVPGAVPFWKGDGLGRPRELGEAIGAFARWAVGQEPQTLERDYDLDRRAAVNLVEFLREQESATRVVPSDRTVVIERFRDEIGDWRVCVLSPYGGRVHAAWGLALSARIREEYGLESDAIWSDDGIIVHLPDADEPPGTELMLIEPDELEDLVVGELGGSALFGARFRENAGRALLIPRAYPGRRTPLWQQRLKSQTLLEVARRYAQFPIVLETYRECLRDVLDLPGLHDLLTKLHRRELSLVEVETPTASPFASSLLFDYVATYMYEGDQPNAERRAAALALDRELLRELLGQEELRELIDPGALATVEADLQRLSERTRADSVDALHDVLRRVGDLTEDEAVRRGGTAASSSWPASGAPSRCAWAVSAAGWPPRTPACTATRSAPSRRPGCRTRSSPTSRTPWSASCAASPAPTARSRAARCATATASTSHRCWSAWSRPASWCAASCVPAARRGNGATPRCCGGCAAPRWPRCGRRSSRPTSARSPASRRAGRASTATPPAARAWTACARCSCRSRACRCRWRCGSATCCRAGSAPTRRPGWTSCARAARWCGWARARWAGAPAGSRCTSARTRRCSVRLRAPASPPPRRSTSASASACGPAPASSPTC